MKHTMIKISALSAGILSASAVMAGGFDNSSRGFDIIYGDNNVITTSYGQTAVPMKAKIQQGSGNPSSVVASGEIIDDFQRPQLGVRYNIAETLHARPSMKFLLKQVLHIKMTLCLTQIVLRTLNLHQYPQTTTVNH